MKCDWTQCQITKHMVRHGYDRPTWLLPVGWVQIDQGLDIHFGGTAPLPDEVDLLVKGRTYCSVLHMAQDLADQMTEQMEAWDADGGG